MTCPRSYNLEGPMQGLEGRRYAQLCIKASLYSFWLDALSWLCLSISHLGLSHGGTDLWEQSL